MAIRSYVAWSEPSTFGKQTSNPGQLTLKNKVERK